jgi:hypothetical protein
VSQQVGIDADGFPVFGEIIDGIVMPDEESNYGDPVSETRLTVPPSRWPAGTTPVIIR